MTASKPRHFLDLSDFTGSTLRDILAAGREMKARRRTAAAAEDRVLDGRTVAMVFEQPSLRTRVSFEVGIRDLGGNPLMLTGKEIELGEREAIADTARVISRYVDAIMIRTDDHQKVADLAAHASVPVINGLTDHSHPCQIMADMLTVLERTGALSGMRWAWLGDGNNVLHSIIEAGSLMHFDVVASCPAGFDPSMDVLEAALRRGATVQMVRDPKKAVVDADVVVTDTWISMGQAHADDKLLAMQPYQVNPELMALAGPDALFLHCLPAHRGEEVVDAVIDGPQSAVWDEAENRLHAQKSVLLWAMGLLG